MTTNKNQLAAPYRAVLNDLELDFRTKNTAVETIRKERERITKEQDEKLQRGMDEFTKASKALEDFRKILDLRGDAVGKGDLVDVAKRTVAVLFPDDGEKVTCTRAIDDILLHSRVPLAIEEIEEKLNFMKERLTRVPKNRDSLSSMLTAGKKRHGWATTKSGTRTLWVKVPTT